MFLPTFLKKCNAILKIYCEDFKKEQKTLSCQSQTNSEKPLIYDLTSLDRKQTEIIICQLTYSHSECADLHNASSVKSVAPRDLVSKRE